MLGHILQNTILGYEAVQTVLDNVHLLMHASGVTFDFDQYTFIYI